MQFNFSGLGHIAFLCCHLDETIRFYQRLGFRKMGTLHGADGSWSVTYIESRRGQLLEFFPVTDPIEKYSVSYRNFSVSTPDLMETVSLMQQYGFDVSMDDSTGVPTAHLRDPEGNWIRLIHGHSIGITQISFSTSAFPQMISFYRDILELKPLQLNEQEAVFRVGEQDTIELVYTPGVLYAPSDAGCFRHYCLQTEDIVITAKMLAEKKIKLQENGDRFLIEDPELLQNELDKVDICGSLSTGVLDPDGNWVEIMQYTTKSVQLLW